MALTITGNVIEDENLGLTTLAVDANDPSDPDNNVILSTFQSSIQTSSSLGTELTNLGIYPSTTTGTGTRAAIGISENTIVSTSDTNLIFSNSAGGALNGVDTGFKAIDGNEIFLYSDPSNPDIVLGREGTGTTANASGAVAFALLLQPTSGGATIWVVQYEALTNTNPTVGEDANTLNLNQLVFVSGTSSSNTSFNIGTKQPGQNYWLPFTSTDGKSTVLVTGLDASATNPDTVNTSSVGDGSDSQSITPGEALRFDFVSSSGFTGGSTKDKTFLSDNSLSIGTFIEGTGASFDISQVTPTGRSVNVKIIAQNESAGTFSTGTGSYTDTTANVVQITEIIVSGTQSADSATGNANGVTFVTDGSGNLTGEVDGLKAGDTITFKTGSAQFDQFVVKNTMPPGNTPGFDILNVTETQTTTTPETKEVGSHIIFEDSVPTASTNKVTGTVDEDALLSAPLNTAPNTPEIFTFGKSASGSVTTLFNPGVDTPLTYRLSSDTSSLTSQNLESHGNALTYAVTSSGGVDTLTASYTVNMTTTTVFTLALTEATGAFTFTLSAPVDQAAAANDGSNTSIDFSSLIQAADADNPNFAVGDMATAATGALKVTVIDDVPVNFNPEPIVSADNVLDAAGSTFTANLVNTVAADGPVDPNSTLTIEQHAGADGFGALTFTGTNGSQLTGQLDSGATNTPLQSNGQNIYLFGFGTGTLTATTDKTGAGLPGGAGGSVITADEVFTITTDPANDQYTFDMLAQINNNSSFLANDFADVPAGAYAWFSLPFTGGAPVSPGKSVVFTGTVAGTDTVNPSSIGVGVDAQNIAIGNDIRVDFVDNVSPSGSTFVKKDLSSLSNLDYADHFEVGTGGFQIVQVNPGGGKPVSIHVDALNVDPTAAYNGGTYPADSGDEVIQSLIVKDSAGNVIFNGANPGNTTNVTQTTNGQTSTANFNEANPTETSLGADGVNIAGLLVGDTVLVSTLSATTPSTTFDRMLATTIGPSSNSTFDMGGVTGLTFVAGQSVNMAFNLALQDFDAFNSGSNTNLTEAGTGTLKVSLTPPTTV